MSVFLVICVVASVLAIVGAILVSATSSASGFEGAVAQPIKSPENPYRKSGS